MQKNLFTDNQEMTFKKKNTYLMYKYYFIMFFPVVKR